MDADAVITNLGLQPHPEGGWYARTWAAPATDGARPAGTAIHYLLRAGEVSRWHTVDAAEVWLFHAGDPLVLRTAPGDEGPVAAHTLGADVLAGQVPQVVVPAGWWQAAQPTGAWTLVSCVVVPGFDFAGFTMAEEGWEPG